MKIKLNKKQTYIFSLLAVVSILYAFTMSFFPYGYVGTTRKDNLNLGCICHGDTASSVVTVSILGPDSIPAGGTSIYTVTIQNGPAIAGGFNVAAQFGTLDTIIGMGTRKDSASGELTHTQPKLFVANLVSWTFTYKAPNTPMTDTLFATANSVNHDTTSSNDKWNWSPNKTVRVYNPIGITSISTVAEEFTLSQNYPNPFNPVTQINFSIGKASNIEIKIYDILGNIVSVPVNQKMNSGTYKTDFNASGLSSGTYFYSLFSNGEKLSTKKMLLVK